MKMDVSKKKIFEESGAANEDYAEFDQEKRDISQQGHSFST